MSFNALTLLFEWLEGRITCVRIISMHT